MNPTSAVSVVPSSNSFQLALGFFLAGGALQFIALFVALPVVILSPSKFALSFTLGNACILSGAASLTGLRAKTANFPGTTVERKVGRLHLDHRQIVVVDLPGLYSLDSKSLDEKLAADALQGKLDRRTWRGLGGTTAGIDRTSHICVYCGCH